MSLFFKGIEVLNKEVYNQLNEILKKLDKRWNLKLYSIVLDDKENCKDIVRIKRTLPTNNHSASETSQDHLNEMKFVFNELGLDVNFEDTKIMDEFIEYCNKKHFFRKNDNYENYSIESRVDEELSNPENNKKNSAYSSEENSRVLYVNNFNFKIDNLEKGTIYYVVEIRNVDLETINVFYNTPVLSFLRMILDYYFIDYFVLNEDLTLKIEGKYKTNKKYNEDSIQFNRRITRLFFGKLEEILQEKSEYKEIEPIFNNFLSNQYYINGMLEKIDDISNHTYERSNPFGSIIFLNTKMLKEKDSLFEYTIKFKANDLVALNDAKLIRKLLELTKYDKNLYLISDHEKIYGLGKINWGHFNDTLMFRIDFKGLSKYNINLITIKEKESSKGELITEKGKTVCKISKYCEVNDTTLLNLSFRTPVITGDGYNSEKFKRLLKSEFVNEMLKIDEEVIEYLEQVVMNARKQKHGTMVVITDEETADLELKTLRKQSILVESTKINPDNIKYLTSIDGAIYFDTKGKCHAIGVILDGIAKEDIGDASRGARYNSAYRYLEKIRELDKKCVIVIISEDGIVNLIPDPYNEEVIYALLQQMIDLINENNGQVVPEIIKLESILLKDKNIDYHLYFKVAEVYRSKDNYKKAIEYYENGMNVIGNNTVFVENYRYLSNLYFLYARDKKMAETKKQKIYYYEKARDIYEIYMIEANVNELNRDDYNRSAIVYEALGVYEVSKEKQNSFYLKALDNYSKALELSKKYSEIIYSNRAGVLNRLGMMKEVLDDLINAALISSDVKFINPIMDIIKTNNGLIDYCIQIILEKSGEELKLENLIDKLKEYGDSIMDTSPEIAASLEKLK